MFLNFSNNAFNSNFCISISRVLQNNVKNKNKCLMLLYYFLLPISRESIVFESNFRIGDFDGFTCFEVS